MAKVKNIAGKTFGNWNVMNLSYVDKHHGAFWTCQCELCGIVYDVRGDSLRDGSSTKCRPCAIESRRKYARVV